MSHPVSDTQKTSLQKLNPLLYTDLFIEGMTGEAADIALSQAANAPARSVRGDVDPSVQSSGPWVRYTQDDGQVRRFNSITGADEAITTEQFDPAIGRVVQVPLIDLPPQGTTSFSVNQNLNDPATNALNLAQFEESVRGNATNELLLREKFELETDNAAVLEAQGKADEAFRAQQFVSQTQARLEQLSVQRQQLQQSAQSMQAQLQQSTNQLNAQAQSDSLNRHLQIMQMAEQSRQFNAVERRNVAAQIAELAADPGDVVEAAAFDVAATQGNQGAISTALGQGQSAITDESLRPLALSLEAQDELADNEQRQQTALGQALANNRPQVFQTPQFQADTSGIDALVASLAKSLEPREEPDARTTGGFENTGNQDEILRLMDRRDAATGVGAAQSHFQTQIDALQRAEHGGTYNEPVVVGDSSDGQENREVVRIVFDEQGNPLLDITPIEGAGPKGAPKAQEGGLFGTQPQPESVARARSLIEQALERVRGRIGSAGLDRFFSTGFTPVGVSAPGTRSSLQNLSASVASSQSGINQESFLSEARGLTPRGVTEGARRRTR